MRECPKTLIAILIAIILGVTTFSACMAPRGPEEVALGMASVGEMQLASMTLTMTGTGATTADNTSPQITGELLGVYIDYTASITATTDLTITYSSPLGGQILAKVNNVTDGFFAPRSGAVDSSGSAITNSHVPFPVNGKLTVTVGQTTPGTTGTLWFMYRK